MVVSRDVHSSQKASAVLDHIGSEIFGFVQEACCLQIFRSEQFAGLLNKATKWLVGHRLDDAYILGFPKMAYPAYPQVTMGFNRKMVIPGYPGMI